MELQTGSFVLASLLSSYPGEDLYDQMQIFFDDEGVKVPKQLQELILRRLHPSVIEDLQSEYIDTFDRGRTANPLYETEYDRQRALAKGTLLSDIAGFYKAFGFELDPDSGRMDSLDHISIELEFYALLLMKQQHLAEHNSNEGVEIVLDARKKFLKDHLGRFSKAILHRPGVQESLFYRPVFEWQTELIQSECDSLGLQVDLVNWFEGKDVKETNVEQEDDMLCGALGACNK